jgi:Fe-S cluster assembly iron-binding protein IscA
LNPVAVDFTVKYLGLPLQAGVSVSVVFDSNQVASLSGSVVLGAGGVFSASELKALVPSGPIAVSVGAFGLSSNEVSFAVDLDQAGLTLSASRSSLEYLNPVAVDFTVKYLGQNLPVGTNVAVAFVSGQVAGLSGSVVLDANSAFSASGLEALVPNGPIGVSVGAFGLSSNEVGFSVIFDQAGLTLSASRSSLEYLNPVAVDFTVKYLGRNLPVGTNVAVAFDTDEVAGLSGSAVLGAGGVFSASALEALVPNGPIGVSVAAFGLYSNEVGFSVDLDQAGLSLSASRSSLEYLSPVSVGFTVKYLGRNLPAGTNVAVAFEAGQLAGMAGTATLDAGSGFQATALEALDSNGPIKVSVAALGLNSNEVDFSVGLNPAGLSLSASRSDLEYLNPLSVDFTVKYMGRSLPAGTKVAVSFESSELAGLTATAALDAGSGFGAPALEALKASGPLVVSVSGLGLNSNEVGFGVSLGAGPLTLTASINTLEFTVPTKVEFDVGYRGAPLPVGTEVGVNFDSGELGGLPVKAVLGQGGKFAATGLMALVPSGSLPVSVSLGGLTSNEVDFAVFLDAGEFTMTASPGSLELFAPTDTAFAFAYRGSPLPAGVTVALEADPGLLENLSAVGLTDGAGELTVAGLTAITPYGPIEVRGTAAGTSAGAANLGVDIFPQGLELFFSIEPDISFMYPHLDPADGPFLVSCVPFDAEFVASYRGRLLPNVEVTLSGFGLKPSGPVMTDANAKVAAKIEFTGNQQDEYNRVGGAYWMTLNGVTQGFKDPLVVEFQGCGIF